MDFNEKQATLKRPKFFLFTVLSCFLLALAFSAKNVFAEKTSPTPPKAVDSLWYNNGNDIVLVDTSDATQGIVWEYAVTGPETKATPKYGWSTTIPTRNLGGYWKVWYRTDGNDVYDACSGYFNATVISDYPFWRDYPEPHSDCLTYTGESQKLLYYAPLISGNVHFRYCATLANELIVADNLEKYQWLDDIPSATAAGDYRVWALAILSYDCVNCFDEKNYYTGPDEKVNVAGYVPVTIYPYDGPPPKLYVYSINN